MMILEQQVQIRARPNNMKWFKSKGYECKYNEFLIVDVNDLGPCSRVEVRYKCDICGEIFTTKYINVSDGKVHTCGKQECKKMLREQTNRERFGANYPSQNKEIARRTGQKFKENYGMNSPKHDEYVKKRNATNLGKCGNLRGYVDDGTVHSKRIKTMQDMFRNAKCRKGKIKPVSAEQIKICEILDGILNYEINNLYIDIALDKEKIAIEYNGIGHYMYRNKENDDVYDKKLHKFGWKVVRFCAHKRYDINDKFIIDFVNYCKKVFDTTEAKCIRYDFDMNKIFIDNEEVKGRLM